MIARVWWDGRRPRTTTRISIPGGERGGGAEGDAGNRGVMVLRRLDGDEAEFGVVSFWDSLDDVKAFAGEDVDAARYFPDDERFLLEFTPRLKHFEVAQER